MRELASLSLNIQSKKFYLESKQNSELMAESQHPQTTRSLLKPG